MKFSTILTAAIVFVGTVAAWTKEDHEIFRLKDEIEYHEGEGATFYSFIGVSSPAATLDDLTKAYRKTSKTLHPDKFKPSLPPSPDGKIRKLPASVIALQKKNAEERYSRLRLVYNILKGPERARYDHFLSNGFPRWRGTGYYYSRFRPGLGSVLVGLYIFVGGLAHYGYLWLNTRQQRKFFENFIREARVSAWGQSGIPGINEAKEKSSASGTATPTPSAEGAGSEGPRNRKERRYQKKASKKSSGDSGDESASSPPPQIVGSAGVGRRKVVAGNGKVLIVNSTGEVFLVEENEDGEEVELKLDIDEIEAPAFRNTAMYRLPAWLFALTVGRFLGKKKVEVEEFEDQGEGEEVVEEGEEENDGPAKKKKKKAAAAAVAGTPVKIEKRNGLPRRKTSGRK